MMYTKLAILLTVVATMISGLVDHSAPYFPIEISRTATGPVGRIVFPMGAIGAFLVSLWELKCVHLPFVGFLLLAVIDDQTSWHLHMLGVNLMAGSIAWNSAQTGKLFPFLLITCIYMGRFVLKLGVTYHTKHPMNTMYSIMYSGKTESEAQLLIFKLGGVLQWVFLYGMLELYCLESI